MAYAYSYPSWKRESIFAHQLYESWKTVYQLGHYVRLLLSTRFRHIDESTCSSRRLISYSIPICWDTEEIAYFVGFQVDLVDQMRDGSYIVNYSLVGNAYANAPPTSNPSLASDSTFKTISMQSIEQPVPEQIEEWKPTTDESLTGRISNEDATMNSGSQGPPSVSNGNATMSGTSEISEKSEDQLLDLILQTGVGGIDLEADKRAFHKLLLGQVSFYFSPKTKLATLCCW